MPALDRPTGVEMEYRKHGRPPIPKPIYDRVRCVEELHHLLRSVVMIRRLKKEVRT